MQLLGAQQEVSLGPAQVASAGLQGGGGALQRRTPLGSGTQGAPLQH